MGTFRFASPAEPTLEICIGLIDYNTGVASTIQRAELVGNLKGLAGGPHGRQSNDLHGQPGKHFIDRHTCEMPVLHLVCKHEEFLLVSLL